MAKITTWCISTFLLINCNSSTQESTRGDQVMLRSGDSAKNETTTVDNDAIISKIELQELLVKKLLYSNDTAEVRRLIVKGADINYKDQRGFYPLFWAKESGNQVTVDFLVNLGAIDYMQEESELFRYCEKGFLDSVKYLHKSGQDLNVYKVKYLPQEGHSPGCECHEAAIVSAVRSGNIELVQYFIANQIPLNYGGDGVQPLSVALQKRFYKIADLLLMHGAEKSDYFHFTDMDSVLLDYLISKNFPVGQYDENEGDLPGFVKFVISGDLSFINRMINVVPIDQINIALCYSPSIEIARLLLNKGADINHVFFPRSDNGCSLTKTPLSAAVLSENIEYVGFCLTNGAKINELDKYDGFKEECIMMSPLTLAISNGQTEIAKFLISKGANINSRIKVIWAHEHTSPIIESVRGNNPECVRILLDKNVKLQYDDFDIFDYVTEHTKREIVEMLKNHK